MARLLGSTVLNLKFAALPPSFPRKREPKTTAGQSRFFQDLAVKQKRDARFRGHDEEEELQNHHTSFPAGPGE
jgi:hypothetical protein